MKYTPLNLNFLSNQYSPQRDSIANTAAMIMANAGWSQETTRDINAEFAKMKKKAQDEYNSAHKQTFLSSVFDLLQTPLYGVANALDEALAGHQESSNDSVLADIAKTTGGVFTGGARGIGAGLRGATGMLDALPGVDINDEWQSDPTDKTHFSDVAIRKETGMSTAEAMQPENWQKILPKLEAINKKPWYEKTLFQAAVPDDLQSPDARQKFFRNEMLAGLPVDIGADPLNYILPGIGGTKRAVQATEGLTEGLDAARSVTNSSAILAGLNSKAAKLPVIKGSLNQAAPVATIQTASKLPGKLPQIALDDFEQMWAAKVPIAKIQADMASLHGLSRSKIDDLIAGKIAGGPLTAAAPAAKAGELAANPAMSGVFEAGGLFDKGAYKTQQAFLHGARKQKAPVTIRNQSNLAHTIVRLATENEGDWVAQAKAILARTPGMKWTNTEKLIDLAHARVNAKGLRHNIPKLHAAVTKAIATDITEAAKPAVLASRQIKNLPGYVRGAAGRDGAIVAESGARPALRKAEAQLANKTIRRFEAEILGKKGAPGTGPALARAIAQGRNVRYSGPQQARMWNQVMTNMKFAGEAKFAKGTRILRAIEDYFIAKGVIPHSAAKTAESVPLRLSYVAEAIGPEILGKSHAFITGILRGDPKALAQLSPDQIEAIAKLRAGEAAGIAPATQKGIVAGNKLAEDLAKVPLSVGRKKELASQGIRDVAHITAASGGGDVGAHVAAQYTGNLLGRYDPINSVMSANALKTQAWLGKVGKGTGNVAANNPQFVRSVTNAITKASNLPSPASLSGVSGAAAKVADWLGARFNAAYGIQDMSPIFLKEQSSALSTTAKRARLINDLGRRFSPRDKDLWHEAFRTAQENGIASGKVAELQSEIAKVMENLFGGTGLRTGAIADSTVVGRNRLLMDELNRNLKRFGLGQYSFNAGKAVKDANGVAHDLSQGTDWLRSWELWKVTDPYKFLHQVQNAVEFTVREKNMLDEVVTRFASPNKLGEVKYGVAHPRLKGYFFTAEGAKQAKLFVRMMEEVATPNSKALQHFDHVLSKLKAALTIYIPGHHMTNLIGDVYYNWIAGVNKPIRYEQAMKTMLAQKGRYGSFADFDMLTGPHALELAVKRSMADPLSNIGKSGTPAGRKTVVTMQNGQKITADMVYTAAMSKGILPSAKVLEDVASEVNSVVDKIGLPGRFHGKGQEFVHTVAEVRDHIPRLAQFIDGIAKHQGTFDEAIEASARSVRKWHPDGLGFTGFERKFMKRVFPFYSWTRKSIPLSIEAAIFAGPKVMAYPRLMEAIGLINGVDPTQQVTDAFPNDQMFPDWLRNRGIGPIAGGPGNYSVVNPSTPVLDILSGVGNPGQLSIDMLNPMAKVPIETMQQRTLGDASMPLQTNQQWLDYYSKQIPAVSQIGRASGQFGVSDSTRAEGFPNWTNILNLLTGAKKVDTGKYQKSAQFDLRDYFRQKAQQQGR